MPHSVAADLGLHCLPITLLGVSRLQWVNMLDFEIFFLFFPEYSLSHLMQIVKCSGR